MALIIVLSISLVLTSCGDPIDGHIDDLIEGGDAAEAARMELNLAKKSAVAPLIAAFEDRGHPVRARIELAEALYRIHMREEDRRIAAALARGLDDEEAAVRALVARRLGDLRESGAAGLLIGRLERERELAVRQELLVALEVVNMLEHDGRDFHIAEMTTDGMSDEEKAALTATLVEMAGEDLPDSLAAKTAEWLEVMAEDMTVKAHSLALQARLDEAEALLHAALALVPGSLNATYKLARFYYDNGQREKGLDLLEEVGLVTRAGALVEPPVIDGVLDDPGWAAVAPLTEFYQCIWKMGAYPIEGRAEAYVGYVGDVFYVAIKGYEERTDNLKAETTQRDGQVFQDDCIEIFLDTNHDYQSYLHLIINSLGTVLDSQTTGERPNGNWGWNGTYEIGTQVAENFWSIEVAIPVAQLDGSRIAPGGIWGFNVARTRIANAAEYGQWTPTYGSALRPDRFGFLVFE